MLLNTVLYDDWKWLFPFPVSDVHCCTLMTNQLKTSQECFRDFTFLKHAQGPSVASFLPNEKLIHWSVSSSSDCIFYSSWKSFFKQFLVKSVFRLLPSKKRWNRYKCTASDIYWPLGIICTSSPNDSCRNARRREACRSVCVFTQLGFLLHPHQTKQVKEQRAAALYTWHTVSRE